MEIFIGAELDVAIQRMRSALPTEREEYTRGSVGTLLLAHIRSVAMCTNARNRRTLNHTSRKLISLTAFKNLRSHLPCLSRAMNEAVSIVIHNARSSESDEWRDGDACVVSDRVF